MGEYTENAYFYKPSLGASGQTEKDKFDAALDTADAAIYSALRFGNAVFPDPSVPDHGDPSQENSIARLVADNGANKKLTVVLRHSSGSNTTPYTILTNLDLSSYPNTTFVFENGALLSPAAGVTVPVAAPIEAGPFQIFSGSGTIAFSSAPIDRAYVQWWGASPNASAATNDSAFQAAINALSQTGITLYVPTGTYNLSTTLTHKPVNIQGADMNTTVLNNSAARCMEADSTTPATGNFIKDIKLVGADFGYHSNGQNQTRMLFERVYLDGGLSDANTPPQVGFGIYANSQWIECRLAQCVINQMGWFAGGAMNENQVVLCRFNASGLKPNDGYVLYIGDVGGTKQNFTVRDTVIEVGGIKIGGSSGAMNRVTLSNIIIADADATGDVGIDIAAGNDISLENITAEDYEVRISGSAVNRVVANNVYCYKVDWNNRPEVKAWGISTQSNTDLASILNDSSFMEHEGTLYGRSVLKKTASILVPADSAAGDTWRHTIICPDRDYTVFSVGFVTESNVTGQNTDYATISFYAGGTLLGSYDFTLGNDATAYVAVRPTVTAKSKNADVTLEVRKTVTGSGLQMPAMTAFVEFYDQGTL